MEKVLFIVFAIIAVTSAANVVVQRKPLYSALSLIGTLISLSALYIMLHAQFIAAMQVIVYAGAIIVLFVFVIMLLNEPAGVPHIEKGRWLRYLGPPLGAGMLIEAYYVLRHVPDWPFPNGASAQSTGTTLNVGLALFTDYLLPFEVTSVLILMAVVGAIVLGKREGD
jgi:NADH-quinone oxidoreductase subunit J